MQKFIIDCGTVNSAMGFWEKYIEITQPESAASFGYNLDAFNDAITDGGPGWPGECEIYFTNTARIQAWRYGEFYKRLQTIADESTNARLYLEAPVAASKAWWKVW